MILRHGYFETYLCSTIVEIIYSGVYVTMFYSTAVFCESCYLCMFGDLIEDVTSRFLICRIISIIYRFESLGCHTPVSLDQNERGTFYAAKLYNLCQPFREKNKKVLHCRRGQFQDMSLAKSEV